MFIPLVDVLRCPKPHADTWLVASIDRADARDMLEGTLGCPECMSEYPVRDGIVYFAGDIAASVVAPVEEEQAIRLAAALDLTDPRMTAALHGEWGVLAPLMRGATPAQLLLINPPAGIASGDGISIVVAHSAPVALGSMHGVALGRSADATMRASLRAALRPGGRIAGPADLPLPDGVGELARDAGLWVAESDPSSATSAPVSIGRRSR